ncbi:M15 family metallopeptidase [Caenimonas sedimenti]|uniref:M15 family metallopeptidase n=1 Tax=Caenimonas sedimenti TaxID=2596921 RepID=A0A562ZLW2_9BURK|nr:M15 family metallopeptidase [Caenimonas sedimenti]TWO69346.1 M15 family metallopeptidase [Caenimonas sedimenti]
MDDLVVLPSKLHPYWYRSHRHLPGRLVGTVVLKSAWERVKAAEDYLRIRDPSIRLLAVDSFRPVSLQASIYLMAFTEVHTRSLGQMSNKSVAQTVDRWVRNPVRSDEARHMTGAAIDVLMMDPRTGFPYAADIARYDSWSPAMEPSAFDRYLGVSDDHPEIRELARAAARELHVREACVRAGGLVPSELEFCQMEVPESHHHPLQPVDLTDLMATKLPYGMEDDLLERCERHAYRSPSSKP